jgi:hypothetical protein
MSLPMRKSQRSSPRPAASSVLTVFMSLLVAAKGVLGMLIQMMPIGAVLTLTTAAALAYGMYDGNYRGNLIEMGNRAHSCAKTAPAQMTVTDDKLTCVHMGQRTIVATISSDGSSVARRKTCTLVALARICRRCRAGLPAEPFRPRPTLVTVARIN